MMTGAMWVPRQPRFARAQSSTAQDNISSFYLARCRRFLWKKRDLKYMNRGRRAGGVLFGGVLRNESASPSQDGRACRGGTTRHMLRTIQAPVRKLTLMVNSSVDFRDLWYYRGKVMVEVEMPICVGRPGLLTFIDASMCRGKGWKLEETCCRQINYIEKKV